MLILFWVIDGGPTSNEHWIIVFGSYYNSHCKILSGLLHNQYETMNHCWIHADPHSETLVEFNKQWMSDIVTILLPMRPN